MRRTPLRRHAQRDPVTADVRAAVMVRERNDAHDVNGRFAGGPRVSKPCKQCGKPYEKAWAKSLGSRYCSRACQTIAQRTRPRPARVCAGCGRNFIAPPGHLSAANRYCSRACFDSKRVRPAAVSMPCASCGQLHERQRSWVRSKLMFCSVACQRAYMRAERHPHYRPGRFDTKRKAAWQAVAAETRERDGRTCRLCGREWNAGERAFPVDHIIPRRSFDTREEADHLDNLATLCPPCHMSKTFGAERRWLKGDALDLMRYQKQVRATCQSRRAPA